MSLLRRIMIGIAIAAVSGGHLEAGGLREEPPSGPGVSIGSTSLPCVRRDAEGGVSTTPRSLMTAEGADVVVVIFVTTTCPIANATTPSIRRLHEAARELGVEESLMHRLVHVHAFDTAAALAGVVHRAIDEHRR